MHIKYKDKFLTIFLWIIILASAVGVVLFLIWSTVYRVETKKLSVINYYSFPVEVSFLNTKDSLEPFQIKTYDINTKDIFNIVADKTDGTELSNIQINGLKLPPQLIEVVLSATKDYCYFNANVTNVYTSTSDVISQINILSKNPLDYFIFGISDNTINVYPGITLTDLSQAQFKDVKGYYPIKCSSTQDSKSIEKIVKTFVNYDYQKQVEYLDQQQTKIQDTQNIDDLNNI